MSNFHSVEVVDRDSETPLQVGELFLYIYNALSLIFAQLSSA